MGEDIVQKLILELQSVRQDLGSIKTAMLGNPPMNVDGMQQHMDRIAKDVEELKRDVHGLKSDRIKVVAWVSGIAAGCSIAATKLVEWVKG